MGDGVILYTAFVAGPLVGLATTLGMMLHEGIEKLATFFILQHAGYTAREALQYICATALCIFVGVGLAWGTTFMSMVVPWLFSASCGALAYLICADVLPCVFVKQKHWYGYIPLSLCLGAGIFGMGLLTALLPH